MAPPINDEKLPIFHPAGVALLLAALGLGYLLSTAMYNAFFHPLHKYPGPKLWAISRIPYTRTSLSGRGHRRILELHQKYGPIVRLAPDRLSYNHPQAWKEIRGHRKNGQDEHGKDHLIHHTNTHSIIGANREDHVRFRRALAHGFSAQAMFDQQPIINEYVDKLFQRLHEQCAGGTRPLDIVSWFNYTTFDIIGDLAFGEPFGCLQDSAYHPWVSLVFEGVKNIAIAAHMRQYPVIGNILMCLMPKKLTSKWAQHTQLSYEKVRKRLSTETDRPDFVSSMTKKKDFNKLTFEEIVSNASTLIVAGSETTATLLSAATYYLTTNPSTLAKLTDEIRSSFATEDEIDLISVQKLSYMLAVLDETLRMYPPVPGGSPRRIAKGGDVILGGYVPHDTIAEIWHWSMYHNPAHFTFPDCFIPERWLDDPRFINDKKEAFQPFSTGPRNCIGKNLAYYEMRLILARLVWNFDLKLAEESKGWDDRSLVYLLWEKAPLNIYLAPKKAE